MEEASLEKIARNALGDSERGFGDLNVEISDLASKELDERIGLSCRVTPFHFGFMLDLK